MKGYHTMPINENTLEQAVITELQKNGYEYFYGQISTETIMK